MADHEVGARHWKYKVRWSIERFRFALVGKREESELIPLDRRCVTAVDGLSENATLDPNLFILLLLNYVKWSRQYGCPCPVPDVTVRHLLWVAELPSSQCAVTPIYKQLLNAIHISVVMACDGLLEWSLKWTSHWRIRTPLTTLDRRRRRSNVSGNATEI